MMTYRRAKDIAVGMVLGEGIVVKNVESHTGVVETHPDSVWIKCEYRHRASNKVQWLHEDEIVPVWRD